MKKDGTNTLTTAPALFFAVILLSVGIPAQAQTISGVLDTQLAGGALSSGEKPEFFWGLEEYANVRLQAKIKDKAAFYSAVNLIAASGSFARAAGALALMAPQSPGQEAGLPGTAPSAFISGENYIAGIELERLYFRLSTDHIGFDAGLMRMPFGYGQVWGSSDFLNPRNPLLPNARPRGILGSSLSFYPSDTSKTMIFASAPKDPFNQKGEGVIFGITEENHWDKASAQFLYAYETPTEISSSAGLHRGGISVKADLEVGLVADVLYTWNPDGDFDLDGLSAGAGFDYSFLDGTCYVLLEYLYNGAASSTSKNFNSLTGFSNKNYLYGIFRYSFNDFTAASLGGIASFDDVSFTPIAAVEYDIFQGMNLTVTVQAPLDRDILFGDGNQGELGPKKTGSYVNVSTLLRLRF
ncbi:MAG: hypothetical protein LBT16_12965 [Treponema sp.]|jgi:hypothetical protein|nr:hypothetical protein [Treponema sp.]